MFSLEFFVVAIFGKKHKKLKKFDCQNFENLLNGPENAQNDQILTIFDHELDNLSIAKTPKIATIITMIY